MLTHPALALLLLLPAAAPAQELDTAFSAVVRISGTRDGTPVRGSGFVVELDRDKATIVTASHVIEGAQQLEVTFAADLARSFPAGAILGMEAGNPRGLAALQVHGQLPAGVATLTFEVESQPRIGNALFLLGFPQMALAPRTTQRVLSGRNGELLLVDQDVGEGLSGGPVLQGGKVVGVVTDTDDQTTYAINALVVREALEGWGIKLGEKCEPGRKESDENGIDFVRICPGTFMMGSAENDPQADAGEKPAHQVTLRSELWINKTEITNKQYRRFQPNHQGEDELPATGVTWNEAKAACESFGGRLPTEAEWEYAARAGSQSAWSFGGDERLLGEHAWYGRNSDSKPHPVNTRKPNGWGLYDMHGNVWEWVADWFAHYEKGSQTDPAGPRTGQHRVLRGGAFGNSPGDLRSAFRDRGRPENRYKFVGFRCARTPRRQS